MTGALSSQSPIILRVSSLLYFLLWMVLRLVDVNVF